MYTCEHIVAVADVDINVSKHGGVVAEDRVLMQPNRECCRRCHQSWSCVALKQKSIYCDMCISSDLYFVIYYSFIHTV